MKIADFSHQTIQALQERFRFAFRDAIICGIASVIAWQAAHLLWGHAKPTFAAVAVIVCLAPGLPNHLQQTARMLLGCTIGIVIAELAWMLPEHHPMLRLGGSVFVALLMGCLLSPTPISAIQAAVSVLLVWAMGPTVAGEVRLLDVCTGAVVGLVFSQILFTENPVKAISGAAQKLIGQLGKGLSAMQTACKNEDAAQAEKALASITQAYVSLTALQTAIEQGNQAVKWSLRGRWVGPQVQKQARRYGRHAARIYGATLLLGEALARTLAHADGAAPAALQKKLEALVQLLNSADAYLAKSDAAFCELLQPLTKRVIAQTQPTPTFTAIATVDAAQSVTHELGNMARWELVDDYASQVAQALLELFNSEHLHSQMQ